MNNKDVNEMIRKIATYGKENGHNFMIVYSDENEIEVATGGDVCKNIVDVTNCFVSLARQADKTKQGLGFEILHTLIEKLKADMETEEFKEVKSVHKDFIGQMIVAVTERLFFKRDASASDFKEWFENGRSKNCRK